MAKLSGDGEKGEFKDVKSEMTPLTTQELAMSLEPRVEVWFEYINSEVTSIQMTFNAI